MTTSTNTLEGAAMTAEQSNTKKNRLRIAGAVGGVVVLILAGRFLYDQYAYQETDDARTSANYAVLSTKVAGMVTEIKVEENQNVKAGDVLLQIDPRDYQNRVEQMQAELGSTQARLHDAEKNFHRMRSLLSSESVSTQSADAAEASFLELSRREAGLKAQLSQSQLDLSYASIRAPTDGKVGKRTVEKGVFVGMGQPVIAFVQSKEFWVVGNFKETQLQHMKIGQPVEVEVDAIGDHTFVGKVQSFAPGSGATFAVIPPDNATGNFVKIVQRVPVRISLEPESIKGYEDRLVPGLSVVARVKVR